jgi:PAS domain S-box-containing protein
MKSLKTIDTHSNDELLQLHDRIEELELRIRESNASSLLSTSQELEFRDMIFDIPQFVYETDLEGNITYANPFALRFIGYSREDLQHGLHARQIVAPECHELLRQNLEQVRQGQSVEFREFTILCKDGAPCPVYASMTSITRNGSVVGIRGVAVDISELKSAQNVIRQNEQIVQAFVESFPGLTMILDPQGIILTINDFAARTIGMDADSLRDRNLFEVLPDAVAVEVRRRLNQVAASGKPLLYEWEADRRQYLNYIYPISDLSGAIARLAFISLDITDQKRMDHALKAVMTGSSAQFGTRYFESVTTQLADILNADYSFIGELVEENTTVRTIAFCHKQDILPNFEYELKSWPLNGAMPPRVQSVPNGAQHQFPQAGILKTLHIEGYVSVPLLDAHRNPLGVIVALFSNPLTDVQFVESVGQMFAVRTAAEIERLRIEAALRDNEEKYRTLYATMTQGVVYQDALGHIVNANPAAERILGLTLDQLIGRTDMDPRWKAAREDGSPFPGKEHPAAIALRTGQTVRNVVMRIYDPQHDKFRWIEIDAVPLTEAGQEKPSQVYTIFSDITERKIASEALQQSEERFRNIFRTSPEPIVITGMENPVCVGVNEAFTQITGYLPEDVVGRTLPDAGLWVDMARRHEMIARIREHGFIRDFEAEFRMKDGAIHIVLVSGRVIHLDGVPHCLWMTHDMHEVLSAKEALQSKSEELDRFFSVNLELLCIADMEGYFHRLNIAWETTLGYPLSELEGSRFLDLVHPDDLESTGQAIATLYDGESIVNFKNRFRCRDGSYRWLEWRSKPFQQKFIYASAHDVTDRVRIEESNRQNLQELSAINRVGGQVSGVVSLEDTVSAAVRALAEEFAPHLVMLFLSRTDRLTLAGTSSAESPDQPLNTPIQRLAERLCTLAMADGRPVYSSNVHEDLRCSAESLQVDIHSFAGIPLQSGSAVIGVLGLASLQPQNFEQRASFLETLAAAIAVNVKKAMLYEELNASIRKLEEEIADRTRAECELTEANHRRVALFEEAQDAMVIGDAESGILIEVNRQAEKMFKRPREELIGIHHTALFAPDEVPAHSRTFEESLQAGRYLPQESCVLASDGTRVPVEINASLVDLGNGRKVIQGIFRDISERKRAEAALRAHQARIESIFRGAPVGIGTLRDRTFIEVNDYFCWMTGYTAEELRGQPVRQLYTCDEDFERVGQEFYQAAREIGTFSTELKTRCKDGHALDIVLSLTPITPGDLSNGVTFVVMDITQKNRAEEAMRQRQARIESIFRGAPVGIGIIDNRRITEANDHFCEMIGYSLEELRGQPTRMFYPSDLEFERIGSEFYEKALEQGTTSGEVRWMTKDGQIIDVLLSLSPIELGTLDAGVTFMAMDITERKRIAAEVEEWINRYDLIVSYSGQLVYDFDIDSGMLTWGGSLEKVLGYPYAASKEYLDEWADRIHPDDRAISLKRLQLSIATGKSYDCEYRYRHELGHYLWIRDRGFVFKDPENRPIRILGMIGDITERKRAEEELRDNEEKYRTLFETMAQGVLYQDADGTITSANPSAARILGIPLEDLISGRADDIDKIWIREDGSVFPAEKQPPALALKSGRPAGPAILGLINPGNDFVRWIVTNAVPRFKPGGKKPYGVVTTLSDITELKHVLLDLQKSEEKFRSVIEASPMGIHLYKLDNDHRLILTGYNAAANNMVGMDHRKLVGKSIEEAFPPLRETEIPMRYKRAAEHGIPWYEAQRQYKDGKIHGTYDVYAFQTSPGSMAALFHNVTEQVRLREQLMQSERTLDSIIKAIPDIVYRLDTRGRITFVNDTVKEYGYEPDELIGVSIFDLVHPEDQSLAHCRVNERRTGERHTKNLEIRLISKNLGTRDFEVRSIRHQMEPVFLLEAEGVYDRSNSDSSIFLGTQGVARDITEQKIAERELIASERRFRNLIRDTPDGVYVRVGHQLVLANPSFCTMSGYSEEELTAPDFDIFRLTAPEDREAGAESMSAFENSTNAPPTWFESFKGLSKDGKVFPVEIRLSRIEWDNQHAILGFIQDISARRTLEEQLRQAQKMEAIGRLAGGVAHDFNNILTAIVGYSELTLLALHPNDPLREGVEQIARAVDRATSLTRQLLAFSRKQVLQPKVLDLNAIIADMQKMLRRLIGEDIELSIHPASGLGLVKADPGQMEQVLMNLVVNARDAMPDGGFVSVATDNVELDEQYCLDKPDIKPGAFVRMSVSDNGSGIETVVLPHIFEPFFTTKQHGKGTGLGLSTVYGIVKQSGGHIAVYSEVGRGTTFKVYLPQTADSVLDKKNHRTDVRNHGTETILVVEDEDAVRDFVQRILQRNGYTVFVADSLEMAVHFTKEYPEMINLLLTDVIMPKGSGADLAKEFRVLRPDAKIMFMSGYTDDAVIHHGVLEPGVAFLPKPFTTDSILRTVRDVLDGHVRK